MDQIGSFDAKNRLSSLLERAERGEEIVITRRGRPVAKLMPSNDAASHDRAAAHAAAARLRARAREMKLGPFNWEEVKKDVDFGRP